MKVALIFKKQKKQKQKQKNQKKKTKWSIFGGWVLIKSQGRMVDEVRTTYTVRPRLIEGVETGILDNGSFFGHYYCISSRRWINLTY